MMRPETAPKQYHKLNQNCTQTVPKLYHKLNQNYTQTVPKLYQNCTTYMVQFRYSLFETVPKLYYVYGAVSVQFV